MRENSIHAPQPAARTLDADTLAFAQKVFQLVRSGAAEQLKPLLDQGLPANISNERGDSYLMLASYHGHLDAARLLLEHGADPEMRNDQGQTPIAGAAFKGDLAMLRLLLDHGADVEGASPDGKTALMLAAMFNRTEALDLLLERGARIDAADVNGRTALDAARIMGAADTAARLEHRVNHQVAETVPSAPNLLTSSTARRTSCESKSPIRTRTGQ
jgi:ankyrin repeat protein